MGQIPSMTFMEGNILKYGFLPEERRLSDRLLNPFPYELDSTRRCCCLPGDVRANAKAAFYHDGELYLALLAGIGSTICSCSLLRCHTYCALGEAGLMY